MRRSNLATLFYLAVVFVSGAVVGGFANRLYMVKSVNAVVTPTVPQPPRSRAELRKQYLDEMTSRLHLTAPQVTQLQQIADATGQQMQQLHQMHKTIDDEHVQKVTAMLDNNQKVEYAKMRAERDKHRQEQGKK
jgi:hypothetical protein